MSEDRAILIGTTEARKILGSASSPWSLLAISPTNTKLCSHAMQKAVLRGEGILLVLRYHAVRHLLWLNSLPDTSAKVLDHNLMCTIVYKA
jgi:hypothetical protein